MTLIEQPAAATGTAASPARIGWAPLAVVLSAIFVSTLDFFIVNVAIPSTSTDLHAGAGQIQWIVAGFALAVGCGVITAGRLGDLFGRRRLFALGLAAFTLSSAACGLAPTAGTLVAARVVQGLAAALMSPQVLAIIGTTYTGKALARAYTAYGLSMGLAAVFGQLIGGLLIQADVFGLGWRACFLINVPIGAAAVLATFRYVPESRNGRARLDLPGVALVTAALVALVLPLIQGRAQGWPAWVWVSFAASAGLFAVFTAYQRRLAAAGAREPLIDPAIFRDRAFAAGVLTQVIAWLGQASFFLVLAVYVQDGLGLSALESGVLFTAIGGGYILTSIASGAVAARLGKQTVALGAALMVAGLTLLELAVRGGAGAGWLVPGLVVDGAGMGLIIGPMAGLVLANVAPRHAGAASGVLATVMQVGGALGVALIGIVFYRGVPVRQGFGDSIELLIGIALAVATSIQLLPTRRPGC
jgi:EmrB/QacA subfamily drug resistance transporter